MTHRAGWPAGPWDNEPDRIEFRHAGFPCLMKRQETWGHWCGYVGVPPGHPWHGQDHDRVPADAHCGLTYGAACDGDPADGICHVPQPGEPEHAWWLGFDCCHAWDHAPGLHGGMPIGDSVYRDAAYVRGVCEGLAEQAAAAQESLP